MMLTPRTYLYLINVTADQPLSENSTARGGVGGGVIEHMLRKL